MSFFNATPLGRIINRLNNDVANIDRNLAGATTIFLNGLIQIVGTLVVIGLSTPYTLASFVPLLAMFYWIYKYFNAANRELKRLDSVKRSPIYQYFDQCLGGLATIRAQLAICKNKSTGQKRGEKGGLRGRKKKNQFSVDRADDKLIST